MTSKSESDALVWDDEVDVVVAGGGGTGLSAAIELREAGADVIVFEKQPSVDDSSSSLCGGVFTFSGTDFQESAGIQDSNELLYKDLMEVGQQKNDKKIVQAYVDNQLDSYKWLNGFGVKWIGIEALAGMSVPRGHVTNPTDALRLLKGVAEKKGARLLFETSVTGLITDKDKRVIGVSAEGRGGSMQVKAKKGVILATGGFGRDVKRLESINPQLSQVVPVVGLGHTGDGHRMAEELGAFFKDIEYVKPTFGIHADSTLNATLSMMFYNGAIIVNKDGRRFINESASYKDIGNASLVQPEGIGHQIFDQPICEAAVERVKGVQPEKALWGLDESRMKLTVKADTIEEMASEIGVPPEALKDTVDRYNKGVDAGEEPEYGRDTVAGGVGSIMKIDTPPFYAYTSKSLLPGTYGGIVVDEDMHVLTRQGRIPGLYAAGELVGGFHGASYMSGSAVGKAIIFGRIAGRNAAEGR